MKNKAIIGLSSLQGRNQSEIQTHCLGRTFVDYLAHRNSALWHYDESLELEATTIILGQETYDLYRVSDNSETQYNQHGQVLQKLMVIYRPWEIIICHDDISRHSDVLAEITNAADDWGNLGLRAIAQTVGTDYFHKLRLFVPGKLPSDVITDSEYSNILETAFNVLTNYVYPPVWSGDLLPDEFHAHTVLARKLFAPGPVSITRFHERSLTKSVRALVRIMADTNKKYQELLDAQEYSHPLVITLESGIPTELVEVVRRTKFHANHLAFDFHNGKLIEVNAGPLSPTVQTEIQKHYSVDVAGTPVNYDLVTKHLRKDGRRIFIVRGVLSNTEAIAWRDDVVNYINASGGCAVIGELDEVLPGDLVWINFTWAQPAAIEKLLQYPILFSEHVTLFPSPRNFVFTSKKFMATLVAGIPGVEISKSDMEVVLESVPLSFVSQGNVPLASYILGKGDTLYGKPYLGNRGRGVVHVKRLKDLSDIEPQSILQVASPAYQLAHGWVHDIRVITYEGGAKLVFSARCFRNASKISKPLDAPVLVV